MAGASERSFTRYGYWGAGLVRRQAVFRGLFEFGYCFLGGYGCDVDVEWEVVLKIARSNILWKL